MMDNAVHTIVRSKRIQGQINFFFTGVGIILGSLTDLPASDGDPEEVGVSRYRFRVNLSCVVSEKIRYVAGIGRFHDELDWDHKTFLVTSKKKTNPERKKKEHTRAASAFLIFTFRWKT